MSDGDSPRREGGRLDLVGITMGAVTVPMAALTVAAAVAGLALLAIGEWPVVLVGLAAIGVGLLAALLIDRGVKAIDGTAIRVARRRGRGRGLRVGLVGAVLPMAAILAWEWACAAWAGAAPGRPLAHWLWSYAVATLPWTAFAMRDDGDRRTLAGIRAYAAHLCYWLLALARLADAPPPLAAMVMALPAALPIAVGTLLAVADRAALRNVRI